MRRLRELGAGESAWLGRFGSPTTAATATTPEQKTAIAGHDPRTGNAVWEGTPEAIERDREEKREALERYKREWGHYPA